MVFMGFVSRGRLLENLLQGLKPVKSKHFTSELKLRPSRAGLFPQAVGQDFLATPSTSRTARKSAARLNGFVRMRTEEPDCAASVAACSL